MTTTTSRRAILAGAAALPALAAPAALASTGAADGPPVADPIFAAIAAHRAAFAERVRCLRVADVIPASEAPPGANEAADAAGNTEYEAMIDMLNTVPTTLPGVAAVARYAVDHGDENWMDVYLDDGSHQSFMESLVLSIADAMDAISDRGEVRS